MTDETAKIVDDLPDADEPIRHKVALVHPRKIEGTPWREVVLREPTAGELIDVNANFPNPSDRTRALVVKLSNIPEPHLRKLHAHDYIRLTDRIEGFLLGGPPTGGS